MSFFPMVAGAGMLFAALTASAEQVLTGHVPEVIARAHLQPMGRLADTNRLHLVLGLPLRHREILTNLLAQIYDPASPNFHKYLTPEQFTEQFGPTTNDYEAVTAFAKKNGLEVSGTHRSRQLVDVQGSTATIEAAFHIKLQTYQHPTEARTFFAPDVDPTVDAGLPIREISGISDYAQLRPAGHAAKAGAIGGPASGSNPSGLYQGKDYRNAYAPGASLAGSGQYVGLFEADGYYASDITLYEKDAGMTNVPLQNVLIDGFSGTPGSGDLEVSLDIEITIAMAPALAGVVVFETDNSVGHWIDVLDTMANNVQISQFSSSWGYTGGTNPNAAYDDVFIKMAMQGQSYFQAVGDGDAWTNPIWVPAASPYLTVVGGTTLTMTSGGGAYTSEKVWNIGDYTTNKIVGGAWSQNGNGYWGTGGGVSPDYAIPTWQTNINMTTNHGSTTQRNIPDVAMVAFDNLVVYGNNGQTDYYSVGTSGAAPLWAGFTALINQQAAASHKVPVGFINPSLYALAQKTNYATLFHDITVGNNTSSASPNNYYAAPGYDLCTGLGTPNGTNLIYALVATLTAQTAPTITVPPASQTVAVGGTASFSLTASGTAPLSYFWRRNTAFVAGATNATYSTNNVQTANSGTQFTCVVSNAVGSVTSQVATLTVELPPSIVASAPTNQTVAAGASASFTVTATGGTPLSYYWMDNGAVISGATTATYATNNVQLTDSGTQFSCLVSNAVGTATSQVATLAVEVPPSITLQPTNQTVAVNGTANFSVTANGTPLNYYWLDNGTYIPDQTNAVFSTNDVPLADSGQQFRCVISNSLGSVTSIVATLTVEVPPAITSSPTNLTVITNGTASFTVAASGSPLSYFWLCNSTFIPGQTNATLTTNHVQLANSGQQFSCLVSNALGTATSAAATLTVAVPPTITAPPTNQTVAMGGTARFSVTATGTALNYLWMLNTLPIPGATNASFATNNVQLANSGQHFSCLVSNAVGAVTSTAAALTVTLGQAQAPGFTISLSGTNLIINGLNGVAGGTYLLCMSTNVIQPVAQWFPLMTNVLATNGNFTLTATNAVNPLAPEQFYLLQVH
jgi:subtilase family serine protease